MNKLNVETQKDQRHNKIIDIQQMPREELEKAFLRTSMQLEESQAKLSWYEEQLRRSKQEKYGASSEKTSGLNQISFFNEAEAEATLAGEEPTLEEITIKEPKKGKSKGKKKKMTENLPTVVIDYVLTPEEQSCPQCSHDLHEMKKVVRKELTVVPARVHVTEHVQHVYACRNCQLHEESTPVVYAEAPSPILKNSLASPSFIASIMTKKYLDALPLYRQEQTFHRFGLDISRQTMSYWVIKSTELWLKPIYDLLKQELLKEDILHADETTLEVIHEPGRQASEKSYMWIYLTGHLSTQSIVIYEYTPGRSGQFAEDFLGDFKGYLHCDGYAGYYKLEKNITSIGCWVHMRRKLLEALQNIAPVGATSKSLAQEGYNLCNQLFQLEKKWVKLTPEERLVKRQEEAEPIVSKFFKWIHDNEPMVLPKSLLGKAFTYAANQEKRLRNFLLDGRLEISNNRAERGIKPFVIGRKNWLFANTPGGAESSAIVYSIVETAKMNNLNPFTYIEYLLETMPNLDKYHLKLDDLLPWSKNLPNKCKVKPCK